MVVKVINIKGKHLSEDREKMKCWKRDTCYKGQEYRE